MKKFVTIVATLLAALLLFSFVACNGGGDDQGGNTAKPGATVTLNKTELVLEEGETERLTATTVPSDESVTFSSSDTSVASVSASGLVAALSIGTATITATAESSGNTATCSVTVNAQPVPALPTDATGYYRVDDVVSFEPNRDAVGSITAKKEGEISTITYDEEAARDDLGWSNYVRLIFNDNMDVSRKTKVGILIRGGGESVWFKLASKSGPVIMETQITAPMNWMQYEFDIPADKRYMLSDIEAVYLNVPRPSASYTGSGSVSVAGVWFSGDSEPTQKPVYNYNDYQSITKLDLSAWSQDAYSDFVEGVATGAGGKTVTGTYDADKDELKFVNDGVNEWKKVSLPIPAANYTNAKVLVICATGTQGMWLKGQFNYNNNTNFEFLDFDGTRQYYFVDISNITFTETSVFTLVPSYLFGGAASAEITIHSVEIMELKAE